MDHQLWSLVIWEDSLVDQELAIRLHSQINVKCEVLHDSDIHDEYTTLFRWRDDFNPHESSPLS